ncbi:hypothetical protein KSP40_PGU007033 [Platanthera guangdongensis]|uniref:Uncharacterized protein n=1 Tax=Platanthera guangdongensis TaxID=2320717 RepID=A0ABR2LCR3_9ASPA
MPLAGTTGRQHSIVWEDWGKLSLTVDLLQSFADGFLIPKLEDENPEPKRIKAISPSQIRIGGRGTGLPAGTVSCIQSRGLLCQIS